MGRLRKDRSNIPRFLGRALHVSKNFPLQPAPCSRAKPAPHEPWQRGSLGSGVLKLAVVSYHVQPLVEEDLVLVPPTEEDGFKDTIFCIDEVLAAAAPYGVLARVITLFRCVYDVVPATDILR